MDKLDENQVAEEAPRGYLEEWKLDRDLLLATLVEVGFVGELWDHGPGEEWSSLVADAFPDAAAAIASNFNGHYSFTIEAQK